MRQSLLVLVTCSGLGAGLVSCLEWRRPPDVVPRSELLQTSTPDYDAFVLRCDAKRVLARRIIAERIPLGPAADLFFEANGERGRSLVARAGRGRSFREKQCRQVIDFVCVAEAEMAEEGTPPVDPPVSAVLQNELDRMLAAGELPPDPEAD
jgi:hypothetical protein